MPCPISIQNEDLPLLSITYLQLQFAQLQNEAPKKKNTRKKRSTNYYLVYPIRNKCKFLHAPVSWAGRWRNRTEPTWIVHRWRVSCRSVLILWLYRYIIGYCDTVAMSVSTDPALGGIYLQEGTPQSSTAQLTDPPLFSIYGGRNNVSQETQNDEVNVYTQLPQEKRRDDTGRALKGNDKKGLTWKGQISCTALNLLKRILFGMAISFLFNSLHYNNPEMIPHVTHHLINGASIGGHGHREITTALVNTLVINGSLLLMSRQFWVSNSNRACKAHTETEASLAPRRETSVLQLSVALVGIVYCFKKITWKSPLQADFTFILVDLVFAKYLGCAFEEAMAALTMSAIAYLHDYFALGLAVDVSLWRASYLFFSSVVFLKLKKRSTLF